MGPFGVKELLGEGSTARRLTCDGFNSRGHSAPVMPKVLAAATLRDAGMCPIAEQPLIKD